MKFQNDVLKNLWKAIKKAVLVIVGLLALAGIAIALFFLVAVSYFSYQNSKRKNTNVNRPRVAKVAKVKHTAGRKVHGSIYTKHFYQGTDGGENELSPSLEKSAEKKVTDGADRYIKGTANRSQYLTYVAPAKLVTLNANTGWGDYIKVAETTAVFVKKADYTKTPALKS